MADSWWWVPHEGQVFLPGRLLKEEGGSTTYRLESGEDIVLPSSTQLEQVGEERALTGPDDICTLEAITAPSLLHSVRVRYLRDDIYTNISRILVAVNPFKPLSIYEDQYIELYQSAADPTTLPPHVFGVGADVFQRLTAESRSQAVLISGESGAGKTESTKLIMLYISQAFSGPGEGDGFEDRILEINPILESFGNAKTGRNNNSSRFGKWIEVLVDPASMRLHGASVTDYLLEVTRVCGQGPGERNYHIFYQLLGDKTGDLDDLKLSGGVTGFEYLKANSGEVAGLSDSENFDMLRKAFAGLKFTPEEQDTIFKIVAGILHLGNVTFTKSADRCEVANGEVMSDAAKLLGFAEKALTTCVCRKRLVVGKDVTLSPLGDAAACRARDSIAKMIYSRLFKWLVERCNHAFQMKLDLESKDSGKAMPFIGVLDIAGFESFATNSLEQLFINLSNEKLQQFFNSYVFKTELNLYAAEGIDVAKVEFADNAEILTLIEGKGGLLPMLDDSTTGIKQTDATYTGQVIKAHEQHPRFVKPKFPNQPLFTIRHFAGDVAYSTEGFLEKNVAQQPPEVLEMMATSELSVLKELAVDTETSSGGPSRGARKATVGSAFRKSLQQLVEKFGEAGAHFVRCVKPNTEKVPRTFQGAMVMDQLRLSGVMEAVKIRKAGFPIRQPSEDFVKRYAVLVSRALREQLLAELSSDGSKVARELLEALAELLESKVNKSEYALGKTKVFMKDGCYRLLEKYRRSALAGPALQIQQAWRGYRVRKAMKDALEVSGQLQKLLEDLDVLSGTHSLIETQKRATVMEGSLAQVDVLLERADRLPVKLPILQRFLKARARIAAEANLARRMQDLIAAASVDVSELSALLARSADYKMKGGVVDTVRERCELLREQLPRSRALKQCADPDVDIEVVQQAVDEAKAAGFDQPDKWVVPSGPELYAAAAERLAQLQAELDQQRQAEVEKAEAAAMAATREKRNAAGRQAAAQAAEFAKVRLLKRMGKAVEELDVSALQEALRDAEEVTGVTEADTADARKLFLDLQSGDIVQAKLAALRKSSEPLDLLQKSNLIRQVEVLGLKVMPRCEEMREVTSHIISRQKTRTFDASDPRQQQVAERCFEDLSNFSGLRDPHTWGGSKKREMAHVSDFLANKPPAMLQWTGDRISETLTMADNKVAHLALRNFSNLLRCMGDKPAAYIGNKEEPIISLAKRTPTLRDEIYVQVLKQLTANPSAESATKGWRLLQSLIRSCALPSSELCEFIKAFLTKSQQAGPGTGGRRQSFSAVAEQRRKSFAVIMQNFQEEQPKLASETAKLLEAALASSTEGAAAGKGPELVEVFTEDGMMRALRVKHNWTLEDLHQRVMKVLALRSGQGFEFFSFDQDEERTPWRLLPRYLSVAMAASRALDAGRVLLFGRANLTSKEDLSVDDLMRARLTFQHAIRQCLGYSLSLPQSRARTVYVKIAAALVATDKVTYSKKKRGRGTDRFNAKVAQLKRELDEGLAGDGVLERYVPAAFLRTCDNRAALGTEVLEVLKKPRGNVNDDGNFELLGKSRALALMQANLPDFEAYVFGPVMGLPEDEVRWGEVKWERAPPQMPKEVFAPLQAVQNMEHQLLVTYDGIELQSTSAVGWSLRVPFRSGVGRWHITGWGTAVGGGGDRMVLSLYDRGAVGKEAQGLMLDAPEGVPEAVNNLLSYFYS